MSRPKVRYGYKVVQRHGSHCRGAIIDTGSAAVGYSRRRWAVRKVGCGPLAVFTRKDKALGWAWHWHSVFRCAYIQSPGSHQVGLWHKYSHVLSKQLPTATDFADAVILLKEIR